MRGKALLFIAFFIMTFGHAQDANNLALDATVKDQDGGKLSGVDIVVIQDGVLIEKVKTRTNGRFDLLLNFDHEYIIEANRPGFVSKRMNVNTNNVPEDEQLWGYEYGGFAIDLFKNIEGVDFSILDKPVAKIYYDPNAQNFTYDKTYTKQIRQELDALLDEYERKEKIQGQLLAQKGEDYELAIRDAENAFEDGDYLVAKENYLAAASLKPSESAPKKKLQEIENKIKAESNTEDQYMSLLASADQLYAEGSYEEAKSKYKEASTLKPDEEYPISKLKASSQAAVVKKKKIEAEALLAEKDRKYNEQINKGDKEFTSGNFQNAKTYYQNALGFKADEEYPKNQITVADEKIVALKEEVAKNQELAELTERYKAQIAKADAAYKSGNLENALTGYQSASRIKTNESYPIDQIELIEIAQNELLENELKKEELEQKNKAYDALIAEANELFQSKEYVESRSKFELALVERPEDNYPESKIQSIDNILMKLREDERLKQVSQEENKVYEKLISEADVHFNSNLLDEAKAEYLSATEMRPNEEYPKSKVKEIETLLKEREIESEYSDYVSNAQEALKLKKFEKAILEFQNALTVKPLDSYPKAQIAKIKALIREVEEQAEIETLAAERETQYSNLIAQADELFKLEQYDEAIDKYRQAKLNTDNAKYSNDQIALAESRKKEKIEASAESSRLAEREAKYSKAITEADNFLSNKKYQKALTSYNLAATINSEMKYPNDQIEKISGILEDKRLARAQEEREETAKLEAAELIQKYEESIKLADAFMDQEDYLRAKKKYNEANDLDQSKPYALNQLKAIEKILLEMKNNSKAEEAKLIDYNNLLSIGDYAVASKQWKDARKAFKDALLIFPNEKIPAARLEEIDQLEANEQQEARLKLFYDAIKEADALFIAKDLDEALAKYQEALTYQDDPHSNARILKIKELQNVKPEESTSEKDSERLVTEESYKEGNAQVTIRNVSIGGKTDTYKRVVHSWGGKYYFLNDQPISELVWSKNSK
jgi:tetratricopeptide (TPR) repeat protein